MTREEFEHIYRQHYAPLYRLARTILCDADESKDVVSEVFVRLLQSDKWPPADKIGGYLMIAVRNRCCDVLGHKSVRERVEKLISQEMMQHSLAMPNDDDRLERLMLFIDRELPPPSRQMLKLRFLDEMTYAEVAQVTGVSRVTIHKHISQALKQIRNYFETAK